MKKPVMVDEIRVALAVDSKDNIEGICAHHVDGQWFPLIAADNTRFEQIEILAEIIAASTGQEIRMVRFTNREVLKIIPGRRKQ